MTNIVIRNKYLLDIRRPHEVRFSRRNLYREIRKLKGLNQREMSKLAGITSEGWRYREHEKEKYNLGELLALKDLVNMDWVEFGALIEKCA